MLEIQKVRPKAQSQIDRFKAKAKGRGADESSETMECAFKRIVGKIKDR
jgi:hypothetical protein